MNVLSLRKHYAAQYRMVLWPVRGWPQSLVDEATELTPPSLIRISPEKAFRALAACAICLVLASTAGQIAIRLTTSYMVHQIAARLNLDAELTVPAWWSSIALFSCAAALAVIGLIRRAQRDQLQWHWLGMAAIFVGMSMDECVEFHELLSAPVKKFVPADGFLLSAWVIPGAAFAVAFLIFFAKFLLRLPRKTRYAFLVAGSIYCSGTLVMESIAAKYLSLGHVVEEIPYVAFFTMEEALEMLGTILFLKALLEYCRDHIGNITFCCGAAPIVELREKREVREIREEPEDVVERAASASASQ